VFVGKERLDPRMQAGQHRAARALVEGEARLAGEAVLATGRIVREDLADLAEEVRAEPRMVADLVDDVAAGVSEAVREHDGVAVGPVAIEPVAHLDRRREGGITEVEQVGEVLASVLAPGGEERDRPRIRARHDPRREEARAVGEVETAAAEELVPALAHEREDSHVRVVVVQKRRVGRERDEDLVDGEDLLLVIARDLPLRRSRHGHAEEALHGLEAVERHAHAVAKYDHDARGALAVLGPPALLGQGRRVDASAPAAT
jgi:hypothetical protein